MRGHAAGGGGGRADGLGNAPLFRRVALDGRPADSAGALHVRHEAELPPSRPIPSDPLSHLALAHECAAQFDAIVLPQYTFTIKSAVCNAIVIQSSSARQTHFDDIDIDSAGAAALLLLPESPRWLVVNGQLDAALAVMHQLYSDGMLPAGTEANTAKVRSA